MSGLLSALRAVREHGLDKVHACAGCGRRFQLRHLSRYGAAYWCSECWDDGFDGLW